MDGQTDILYFHSEDLAPWPAAAFAARNYRPLFYDHQKATRTTIQRDIEKDIQTHKLNWTPLGSSGPQCGDKIISYIYIMFDGTKNLILHYLIFIRLQVVFFCTLHKHQRAPY